jgi:hypothetical protein
MGQNPTKPKTDGKATTRVLEVRSGKSENGGKVEKEGNRVEEVAREEAKEEQARELGKESGKETGIIVVKTFTAEKLQDTELEALLACGEFLPFVPVSRQQNLFSPLVNPELTQFDSRPLVRFFNAYKSALRGSVVSLSVEQDALRDRVKHVEAQALNTAQIATFRNQVFADYEMRTHQSKRTLCNTHAHVQVYM